MLFLLLIYAPDLRYSITCFIISAVIFVWIHIKLYTFQTFTVSELCKNIYVSVHSLVFRFLLFIHVWKVEACHRSSAHLRLTTEQSNYSRCPTHFWFILRLNIYNIYIYIYLRINIILQQCFIYIYIFI